LRFPLKKKDLNTTSLVRPHEAQRPASVLFDKLDWHRRGFPATDAK